jgi:hypothetical protein
VAYAARQYSVEHSEADVFWPAFWRDESVSVKSGYVTAEVTGILFSGEAGLIWPAQYLSGAAPGAADSAGCALSEPLAWRLWGGVDVVGKPVEIGGSGYWVRGVFAGAEEMALVSLGDENTSQGWNAAELAGASGQATRSGAESYAVASGLGKPDAVLTAAPALLAQWMAALPLAAVAGYGVVLLFIGLWKRHHGARQIIFFVLAAGLAALLPALLGAMPDGLIPGSWSDFSFWGDMARQLGDGAAVFFGAAPRLRDIEGKMALLRQLFLSFAAVICALIACARWRRKLRETIKVERAK